MDSSRQAPRGPAGRAARGRGGGRIRRGSEDCRALGAIWARAWRRRRGNKSVTWHPCRASGPVRNVTVLPEAKVRRTGTGENVVFSGLNEPAPPDGSPARASPPGPCPNPSHSRPRADIKPVSSRKKKFIAPSLPIRVDQAVMPTPRGRRPPPPPNSGGWGSGLSHYKRFRGR